MYIPKYFEENENKRIIAVANEYAFATVITSNEGVPTASHLPLIIEEKENQNLIVLGHMAKANEQWHHFKSNNEVLVIFQGPHAYISPSNYEGTGVPTWNYAAVHLYGLAEVFTNENKLRQVIESLTNKYEASQSTPWVPEYPSKMLDAIVGFEIKVNRIEAKFKLSQNRPKGDRNNVIHNLSSSADESVKGVARLMTENEL